MRSSLNKIILFTVMEYLDKHTKTKSCYQRDKMIKILGAVKGYSVFHRFSKEEAEYITKLGKTDTMKNIKEIEVDYAVYALELLNIWIDIIPKKERPHLNYSDKRIKFLKAELIRDLLALKYKNEEEYSKVKEIVTQSRIVAKQFFHYFDEETRK